MFIQILKKLAEKTYPGRIHLYSAIVKKTDFLPGCCTKHLFFAFYLPLVRPTSGALGGRISIISLATDLYIR